MTLTLLSVAQAESTAAPPSQVAVLVKIALPPGIDRQAVVAAMTKSAPEYQKLPGLVRKYFTISDDQKVGGIYLWENRKAAEAYFNGTWRAKVTET